MQGRRAWQSTVFLIVQKKMQKGGPGRALFFLIIQKTIAES
jgi:hypothetical protein